MKPKYFKYGDVLISDMYPRSIEINYFNFKNIFYWILIGYPTSILEKNKR